MRKNRFRALAASVACVALCLLPGATPTASAGGPYQLIEGTGSTWSQNALNQWIADVASDGIQVAYGGGGSSQGRQDFGNDTVDFAVTEIPFQGRDPRTGQSDSANGRKFAYMPVVAGGTSFMYHLEIGGKLYTGLRLSGETIAKIFTGHITNWDDPEITADNNGFKLPSTKIVPVVRSDGSGTTAQLTTWMDNQYPSLWRPFCQLQGADVVLPDQGRDGREGRLGRCRQPYLRQLRQRHDRLRRVLLRLERQLPGGEDAQQGRATTCCPTAYNVAVALTQAKINEDKSSPLYLTQILTGVYTYSDPRTYPLSSYSYMIVPTGANDPRMNPSEGEHLRGLRLLLPVRRATGGARIGLLTVAAEPGGSRLPADRQGAGCLEPRP